MVATPQSIPGDGRDPLVERVAALEKQVATLANRTRLSTVTGTLVAFDPDDGSNTVVAGDSTWTDIPLLVSGAEIGLEAGDTVSLMQLGDGTTAIAGKLADPGSANYGASNNGRVSIGHSVAGGFGSNAASVNVIVDTSVVVPGWAHSVAVAVHGQAQMQNNSGVSDFMGSQVSVEDPVAGNNFSSLYFETVLSGAFIVTTAILDAVLSVTPGQRLSIRYRVQSNNTWPTNANNNASLTASLQFFRESIT